jgi:hypothetical protein
MENKKQEVLSLGSDFEVIEAAPAPTAAVAAAAPVTSGPMPMRAATASGSVGLLIALGGLLGSYPGKLAVVQAAAAAFLVFEVMCNGLGRVQPIFAPHQPIGALVAIVAGVLGIAFGASEGIYFAPGFVILGGLYALAMPMLAKKADSKLPPAPPTAPADPQFSKLLLGNLLVAAGTMMHWTDAARGADTILGVVLMVCTVLGIAAAWIGMGRTWAMPAVSGGLLGMSLIFVPLDGILLGAFGIVRHVRGTMDLAPWPGSQDLDFIQYGLPILLVIGASVWSLVGVVQGTMKGVETQKQRKAEDVAARKAARADKK